MKRFYAPWIPKRIRDRIAAAEAKADEAGEQLDRALGQRPLVQAVADEVTWHGEVNGFSQLILDGIMTKRAPR